MAFDLEWFFLLYVGDITIAVVIGILKFSKGIIVRRSFEWIAATPLVL